MFKTKDTVEFTTTVTCRVVAPVDYDKSLRIPAGTLGIAYPDKWPVLPGDVPVLVKVSTRNRKLVADPDGDGNVAVAARFGHVVPVKFERSDGTTVKIYRNARVLLTDQDDD